MDDTIKKALIFSGVILGLAIIAMKSTSSRITKTLDQTPFYYNQKKVIDIVKEIHNITEEIKTKSESTRELEDKENEEFQKTIELGNRLGIPMMKIVEKKKEA